MARVLALLTVVLLNTVPSVFAQHTEAVSDRETYDLLNAGSQLLQQNKLEEACEKFRQALARDPKNQGAEVDLGGTLIKLGKFDEA